ncbi:MAG: hypothetical protein AB8G23_14640 [Myxococcota bacterium]
MSAEQSVKSSDEPMNMMELAPEFFERFFAFFRPGHQEGICPSRIKELARLKIASINECDT